MPRLSVDIDLTFVPINSRAVALEKIRVALRKIRAKIISEIPGVNVVGPEETGADVKLFCQRGGSQIKIEVNTVMRGLIEPAELRPLVPSATDFLQAFCEVKTVSTAQLYGGKLCAALDRQHPRDLFDVALFFDQGGEIETIKRGLIYALLCSNRPLHELLSPNPNNQKQAFNNQFQGMTQIPFTYQDFEIT